jgi:hypothetical protein
MGYSFQLARNESSVFNVYNFVNAKESLKGQCHEILDFRFFSGISFPQAPEYPIRAVSNLFENLRKNWQLIDTGGKFTAGVVDQICKGGRAAVLLNPQILGHNMQSQIRKFLRYVSPQISFD